MSDNEDIKSTLKDILEYVNADIVKYKDNAQLIMWIENLIKRVSQNDKRQCA